MAAWEHAFLTAQPHAHVRFRRAIERRAPWLAEDAARELRICRSRTSCSLSTSYAARGSPKYERAALRWLERFSRRARAAWQGFSLGETSEEDMRARW